MEQVHFLRAAHHHITDSWDNECGDIVLNTVFDDNVAVMAVYACQKDNLYVFQDIKVSDEFRRLAVSHHFKLGVHVVLINEIGHPLPHIPHDEGFLEISG